MTVPARGEGPAAGERAAYGNEPEQPLTPRRSPARLVRLGGCWLCDHELAVVSREAPADAPVYRPIAEPD